MSYLASHRANIESILCSGAGTTHTITAGTFHLASDDSQDYQSRAERRVTVRIGPRVPLPGLAVNQLDSFGLYQHPVTIMVEYLRTTAGGDLAERLGEQGGPATDDAIDDRIALDQHQIENALAWYENWTTIGTDPAVIKLVPAQEAPPTVVRKPDVVAVTHPYVLWVQATITGSYQGTNP